MRFAVPRAMALVACCAMCCVAQPPAASADDGGGDLLDLTLEQLLNLEVQVATAEPQATRDAPAVITVVTRDEIEQWGARDLIDVLRRVPGFDFGVDVWGVVGLGFRGHWGHEAKIMLAMDGMILNEPMYGNLAFGNHIPVSQIERIEIARGPGSVIHGNYAELAVINVITRIGSERTGFYGSATTGWFESDYARVNLGAGYGWTGNSDSYLGIFGCGAIGQRSAQTYTDIYGDSYEMNGDHDLNSQQLGLHYRRGGLRAHFLYDDYRTTARDAYDEILPVPLHENFLACLADLSYAWALRPGLTITPQIKATHHRPWHNEGGAYSDMIFYDTTAQKCTGVVRANWNATEQLALLAGGQYEWEGARYDFSADYLFPNGKHTIDYRRRALFAEGYLKTAPVNVTAGLRWEGHSEYNSALAPRLGLTHSFGDTHIKLIYNRSYRAPSIEQISSGIDIKTEEADVFEIEAGREMSPNVYCGVNLYHIQVHRPLLYVSQDGSVRNFDDFGTRGVEAEGRLRGSWGHVTASYSLYAAVDGVPSYYEVPGEDQLVLGFPSQKVVLTGALRASSALTVSATVIWTNAKYAYDHADSTSGEPLLSRLGAEAPVDVYLRYRGFLGSKLAVGLGVFDVFGVNHVYVQPYNGLHAPLPGPGREFLLRVELGLD